MSLFILWSIDRKYCIPNEKSWGRVDPEMDKGSPPIVESLGGGGSSYSTLKCLGGYRLRFYRSESLSVR